MSNNKLDSKVLENWLWDAACIIRGPIDAPKYKDYILPLIFFKRLSDVFRMSFHGSRRIISRRVITLPEKSWKRCW